MYLDVVDSLRCPADHEESTLVASIDRLEGRYISRGSLGCPICRRQYPVRDFVAWFAPPDVTPASPTRGADTRVDEHTLARSGALLDARAPGAFFLLAGDRARLASPLAVAYDVHCIAMNPPAGIDPGDGVSIIRVADRVPLAHGCVAGAAVDQETAASALLLAGIVAAVRAGGRIVAPSPVATPDGLRELARDDTDWVAERVGAPPEPIPLRRAPR